MFAIFSFLLTILVIIGTPFWYDIHGLLYLSGTPSDSSPDWRFAIVYVSYIFAIGTALYAYYGAWQLVRGAQLVIVLLSIFFWGSTASLLWIQRDTYTIDTRVELSLGIDGQTYYLDEPTKNGESLTFSLDDIAKNILPSDTGEFELHREDTISRNRVLWFGTVPIIQGEKKIKSFYTLYIPPRNAEGTNMDEDE